MTDYIYSEDFRWQSGNSQSLVLLEDTGVELGNPRDGSLSFLLWTDEPSQVRDGIIHLIGPELRECAGRSIPFGKIIIAGVTGFNENNSYDRLIEMDGLRFDINLKGYMIRAVSQYQREWSRVSTEAVDGGFSFEILGSAQINKFKMLPYVETLEVIFITSNAEDIKKLKPVSEDVLKITSAMTRMFKEMSFDCGSCEHTDICNEVADLKKMRDALIKTGGEKNVG